MIFLDILPNMWPYKFHISLIVCVTGHDAHGSNMRKVFRVYSQVQLVVEAAEYLIKDESLE